ncbi:MAG: hypothetical protein ABIO79_10945 [Ferruginibacter sp.]
MTQSLKTFSVAILLIAVCSGSMAQNMYASNSNPTSQGPLVNPGEEKSNAAFVLANPAAESSFSKLFPAATQVKWSSIDNYFWASFVNEGRKAKASFTQKGALNYLITDCNMEQLPTQFSKFINKDYAGYRLFNAIEIKAYDATAYQAVVENDKGFVTLKYTADGVEILQQVKK